VWIRTHEIESFSFVADDYGDETLAAIKFGEEFAARYGQPHPQFFPGSLDQAIRESCLQPAKDVSTLKTAMRL
jgi:hypothetical protein